MRYSVIVPVFNRPDEVDELLDSLTRQTVKDFEVIIVEDGSTKTCKDVCEKYASILDLHYYFKENSGPGQSRNYGAERSKGEYLVILDSDVVLPDRYIENLELRIENYDMLQGMNNNGMQGTHAQGTNNGVQGNHAQGTNNNGMQGNHAQGTNNNGMQGNHNSQFLILNSQLAAFGGPDAAHPSFTPTQKAISYSMTSFFTTGGIRGGKKKLDKFYPRSFNMGIRRDVYMQLGGFTKMRFGEDIDFSYRICEAGYVPQLIPEAWVWHKRRTDFRKFFRQVYNSGIARINLEKRHPGTMKLVHLLPAVFTIGVTALILIAALGRIMMVYGKPEDFRSWYYLVVAALAPLLLYSLLIFTDSSLKNHSMKVGALSVPAAFIQLMGYGTGFLVSWWKRCVLGKDEFHAFEKNFYK